MSPLACEPPATFDGASSSSCICISQTPLIHPLAWSVPRAVLHRV